MTSQPAQPSQPASPSQVGSGALLSLITISVSPRTARHPVLDSAQKAARHLRISVAAPPSVQPGPVTAFLRRLITAAAASVLWTAD